MSLHADDITALLLTIRLAVITTVILLLIGAPFALWLSRTRSRLKPFIEAVVALPLVLPPTVLGFYLLLLLGNNGPIGNLFQWVGLPSPVFNFTGLVIGSVVYSLPFVVQPLMNSFAAIGDRPMEVASTLRSSPLDRYLHIMMPLARPGFITASVLGFAHTLGEFGVILMIGGNIPGQTKVVSIAIYDHVEALDYQRAHALAAILLTISFILLVAVYASNKRMRLSIP